MEMATCVLDVTQVASSLAQFSLSLKETIWSCEINKKTKGIPVVGHVVEDLCIARVGLMLHGFFSAA
eukprot:2110016-Heterocapsa_arctica.AAC.1